jgi:hypothetical protein
VARRLDFGTSDKITLAAGALTNSTRAGTLIILVKRASVFNQNMAIVSGRASTTVTWDLHVDAGTPFGDGDFGTGGSSITLDNWTVIAVTKTSGTTSYRYHVAEVGGAWTHNDSGFNLADGAGGTDSIEIGTGDEASPNVDIAAAAKWATDVLSDAEIEALGTTDMADWMAGAPDGAWQFNQASTSDDVLDLTGGGADQTAISGTTVVTDPVGWTYFSGGVVDEGTLTATLPALAADISAHASVAATLAAQMPTLTAVFAGNGAAAAILTGALPVLIGAFAETQTEGTGPRAVSSTRTGRHIHSTIGRAT